MKKILFLLLFAAPMAFGFATLPEVDDCACKQPANLKMAASTSGSATYTWDAVSGATGYKVKYERLSDGYKSPEWTTTSTSYTFTGLDAGAYKFSFASVCGGEVSGFIVIEDIAGT